MRLPAKVPPKDGADNPANCRSTNSNISLYLTNEDDTSSCKFDIKITWGDGKTDPVTNFPGGPTGREFLAVHDYSDVGIYGIGLTDLDGTYREDQAYASLGV
jgi:hypothetical protein